MIKVKGLKKCLNDILVTLPKLQVSDYYVMYNKEDKEVYVRLTSVTMDNEIIIARYSKKSNVSTMKKAIELIEGVEIEWI